jgi:large subunit ribosomal protein L21
MLAIIRTGGKQYRVQAGDILDVEKLDAEPGARVAFDQVLLIDDDKDALIGTPVLERAVVRGEVIDQHRDDKILVFKKKRRKQYRRTRGHRQALTRVRILAIHADRDAAPIQEFVPPPAPEPRPEVPSGEPAAPAAKPKKAVAPAAAKPKAVKAEPAKAKAKDAKKAPAAKKPAPSKRAAKSKE